MVHYLAEVFILDNGHSLIINYNEAVFYKNKEYTFAGVFDNMKETVVCLREILIQGYA